MTSPNKIEIDLLKRMDLILNILIKKGVISQEEKSAIVIDSKVLLENIDNVV